MPNGIFFIFTQNKNMKLKTIIVAASISLLISCGTKKPESSAKEIPAQPTVTENVNKTEMTPEVTEGKNLFENSCAGCHKLYEPKKFSQEEWKPILVRMQKKAHLDDTQIASISNYITSQL